MILPMYKTVIGLRHKRLFSFSSNSGKLIDHLVAQFPKKESEKLCLTKIGWKPDRLGARLTNDLGNFSIDLDFDGIILSYNYLQDDDILPERIVDTFDNMMPDCLRILDSNHYVNRIGIIKYYAFDEKKNAASELSNRLLSIQLNGIADNFTLRFALKNPTCDTLVRTDTLDYTNVIFSFNSERIEEEDQITRLIDVFIDYQLYMNPEKGYKKGMIKEQYLNFNRYLQENNIDDLIDFNKVETKND